MITDPMRRAGAAILTILAGWAVAAAPASADGDVAWPLANSPTGNSLVLTLVGTGREDALISGKTFSVHGVVNPFQDGQQVTVTFTQRGQVAQETTVGIVPAADGSGTFDVA